jgi:hypothetical protein
MRRSLKIFFLFGLGIFFVTNISFADTIPNWQFYHNDSLIFKDNMNRWLDSLGNYRKNESLTTVTIEKYDEYRDSLGLEFNSDEGTVNYYFFIKDENDVLVYIAGPKKILKKFGDKYYIYWPRQPVYIPLWAIDNKIKNKKYKIYYLDPTNEIDFPNGKERLLGIIAFK